MANNHYQHNEQPPLTSTHRTQDWPKTLEIQVQAQKWPKSLEIQVQAQDWPKTLEIQVQAQQCGRVKPVSGIPTFLLLLIGVLMKIQI